MNCSHAGYVVTGETVDRILELLAVLLKFEVQSSALVSTLRCTGFADQLRSRAQRKNR